MALLAAMSAAGCASMPLDPTVELVWPAAIPPDGAQDLHYEVAVWERHCTVPGRLVFHQPRVRSTSTLVPTARLPAEVCWSVRARWCKDGRARHSRWLDADGRPVHTAQLPSPEFACGF